jgi:hypothetical protein
MLNAAMVRMVRDGLVVAAGCFVSRGLGSGGAGLLGGRGWGERQQG